MLELLILDDDANFLEEHYLSFGQFERYPVTFIEDEKNEYEKFLIH